MLRKIKLVLGGIDCGCIRRDLAMSLGLLQGVSGKLVSDILVIFGLGILLGLFSLVTSLVVGLLQKWSLLSIRVSDLLKPKFECINFLLAVQHFPGRKGSDS